jgi:hypothetical protein
MHGAVPPIPNTFILRGAWLTTGTTLVSAMEFPAHTSLELEI